MLHEELGVMFQTEKWREGDHWYFFLFLIRKTPLLRMITFYLYNVALLKDWIGYKYTANLNVQIDSTKLNTLKFCDMFLLFEFIKLSIFD